MVDREEHPPIEANIVTVRRRMARAAERVGRDPASIALIAVSKRQPVPRIAHAAGAGLKTFGENQVQEAARKAAELPVDLDWHLIGHLQSNKTADAVRLFSTIHSLDRPRIIVRVAREAVRQGRVVRGFLQINLGEEPTKGGFSPSAFAEEVEPFARLPGLDVIGLMAIPPYEADPNDARRWFAELRSHRDALVAHPAWRNQPPMALSMGMSNDFEAAIEEGATHVRVGTSLFGPRPS